MESEKPIIFTSIGEIFSFISKWPRKIISTELVGLITYMNDRGKIIFLGLTDGTGIIQIILEKNNFLESDWLTIKKIKKDIVIGIQGIVGKNERGKTSVFVKTPILIKPILPVDRNHLVWPDIKRLTHQIYLSKMRKIAERYLERNNFLQIEPRYISTSWNGVGVSPLQVIYPGFGLPVFLAPSPSSQILKTISMIGKNKVFAVSKCFTSDYRDDMDSTESTILSGIILNENIEYLIQILKDIILEIWNNIAISSERSEEIFNDWKVIEDVQDLSALVSKPSIFFVKDFEKEDNLFGKRKIKVVKALFPNFNKDSTICLGDGAVENYVETKMKLISFNIHLDRIIQELQSEYYRDIFNLSLNL